MATKVIWDEGLKATCERCGHEFLAPYDVEREQLEDAALTALKAEMRDNPFLSATSSTALMVAVADLIAFERRNNG